MTVSLRFQFFLTFLFSIILIHNEQVLVDPIVYHDLDSGRIDKIMVGEIQWVGNLSRKGMEGGFGGFFTELFNKEIKSGVVSVKNLVVGDWR